jgi:hypothetical protein
MARCGDPTGQRPLHWRRHPCNNPGSGGARRQSRPSRGEAGGWSTIRTSARKQDGPAGYRKRQQSNNVGGDFHDTSSPAVNVLQTSPFPAFLGAHLRGGVSISAVCGAPTTDSLAHPKRAITFLRAGGSAYSPRNLGIDAAQGTTHTASQAPKSCAERSERKSPLSGPKHRNIVLERFVISPVGHPDLEERANARAVLAWKR